jgi:hypothetical protein
MIANSRARTRVMSSPGVEVQWMMNFNRGQ